jgi:hypothetical protein
MANIVSFEKILLTEFLDFKALQLSVGTYLLQVRVARFFLVQHIKMGTNVPNDHKIGQMGIKQTNWP